MKSFELNNYQLSVLQNKRKVYSNLYGYLDHAYFKLSENKLEFALIGQSGMVKTSIDIDYTGDTQYFGIDYKKFDTILQKFALDEKIKLSLSDSLLKISAIGRSDTVNLQIVTEDNDSKPAENIDKGIDLLVEKHIKQNHKIVLSDEMINNINLFNYVFNTNSKVNAIGLTPDCIMYSDRSVVIKSTLVNKLSNDLFDCVTEDDPYVYLHVDTLKLLILLSTYRNEFLFDETYDIMYWEDGDTKIIFNNDQKSVALPTQEQYDYIRPQDRTVVFEIGINKLKEILEFFNGIYVEPTWKPLEFKTVAGQNVVACYNHPTTEAEKEIDGVVSNFTGSFLIDAETLRKIVTKITDFTDPESTVVFNYDEDTCEEPASGVFMQIGENFEAVVSKLLDD